jgi:hypothetical protein
VCALGGTGASILSQIVNEGALFSVKTALWQSPVSRVGGTQSYESVGVEHDFMTDLLQDPQGAGARWDNFQFAMYSKRRVWCAPGFYYATEPLLCGGDQRPSALATRDNSGYNSADGHIDSVGNDYHLTDNPSTGGGYNQQTLDRCT